MDARLIAVIERDSPAWHALAAMFADDDVRKVSLNFRLPQGIAAKADEQTWTPTLGLVPRDGGDN